MGITYRNKLIALIKAPIADPATRPSTFRKRCRELLEKFPSDAHSRFVNKFIFARILSDDPEVSDSAGKFRDEIENARLQKYRKRTRKLAKREIPPGFELAAPTPTPEPVEPTPVPAAPAAPVTIPREVLVNRPAGAKRVRPNENLTVWTYLSADGTELGTYEVKNG